MEGGVGVFTLVGRGGGDEKLDDKRENKVSICWWNDSEEVEKLML